MRDCAQFSLTLLMAPAGFGKSVAARQYLASAIRRGVVADFGHRVRDIRQFARTLRAAIHAAIPQAEIGASIEESPKGEVDSRDLAAAFVHGLAPFAPTIVVDGLSAKALDEPHVRTFLIELVERSSAHDVRWIFCGRNALGLPIASWMAYQHMDSPITEEALCFTREEAGELAALADRRDDEQVHSLYALTQGWPAAFSLAVRGNGSDLPGSVLGFVEEQVLADVTEASKSFMAATSVLPSVDLQIIGASVPQATENIASIRRTVPLIHEISDKEFRYHPLLKYYFERHLRQKSEGHRAALLATSEACEGAGHIADALDLALRADDVERIAHLVAKYGFEYVDRGDYAELDRAMSRLEEADRTQTATMLALRAMRAASDGGNMRNAIALFERAVGEADGQLQRIVLARRFVLEVAKRQDMRYHALIERYLRVLEGIDDLADASPEVRARVCGALSVAYTVLGDSKRAQQRITQALDIADATSGKGLQALVFHQASYVAFMQGSAARASRMAMTATELALEAGLYSLASRSWSTRYRIALSEHELEKAIQCMREANACAAKAGDRHMRINALAGTAFLFARRGDIDEVDRIIAELEQLARGLDLHTLSMLPTLALRAAWRGDLHTAYATLAGSALEQPNALRQALRWAMIALYAAGAGLRDEALEAAGHALALARSSSPRISEDVNRRAEACAWAALALIVAGRSASANGVLAELGRSRREQSAPVRAIVEVVRAHYIYSETGHSQDMEAALDSLRRHGYGGYALMVESLPMQRAASPSTIAQLTNAEIQVLVALASGGSSTRVAASLQRSVNTVNSHIKSILRKTGCANRYEAVEIARQHGLVP